MADLSFVVISDQAESGAEIKALLEATGHARVTSVVTHPEDLAETIRNDRPDALFADLGNFPHEVIEAIDGVAAPRPLLMVCGPQDNPDIILRAMKQGAKEYLAPNPDAAAIEQGLARLLLESRPAEPRTERRGLLVAVMGAKGGVGSTTVACQLAGCLAQGGARTALIDLDFPFGDVAVHFDVTPRHSIADLAEDVNQIDSTFLQTVMQPHPSGVQILAGPTEVTDAQNVRPQQLDRALEILRDEHDWIVVDISHCWYEISAHVLDIADQILLVASMDVPTLHRARRHIELMRRLGHSGARTHVVVNRRVKSDDVSAQDVAKFLGTTADVDLPFDYASASTCVNQGAMLSEVSSGRALHRSYQTLTARLHEWSGLTPPAPEKGGLISRLRGNKRKR